MTNGSSPAGWYQDPTGQGDSRYWNGTSWTEAVDRGGQRVNVPIDPTTAQQTPLPGTQVQATPPAPVTYNVEQRSSGSSGGVIIGLVIALLLFVVVVLAVENSQSSNELERSDIDIEAPADDAPAEDAPAEDAPAEDE